MSTYKLLLDESGKFDGKIEKYIIIEGVFFNWKKQEEFLKYIAFCRKPLMII